MCVWSSTAFPCVHHVTGNATLITTCRLSPCANIRTLSTNTVHAHVTRYCMCVCVFVCVSLCVCLCVCEAGITPSGMVGIIPHAIDHVMNSHYLDTHLCGWVSERTPSFDIDVDKRSLHMCVLEDFLSSKMSISAEFKQSIKWMSEFPRNRSSCVVRDSGFFVRR